MFTKSYHPACQNRSYSGVDDFIYYLKGLRFDRTGIKRCAITFGSMGGKGGAIKMIADELTAAGFDIKEQKECFFVPDESELEQCFEMGKRFVATLSPK